MRKMTYAQAINETLRQLLQADEKVFLMGQGVTSPWYVGTTTAGLIDDFGERRIIDTPVSENAVTGAAVGAALAGMRPIVEHPRMDFMYLAMDQIANHAANWRFMFGGKVNVPLTIWGIVNRGGEQAAQHSQALQAMFAHIPGLKVVAPSTPYDAKGLLAASVADDDPVLFIDDRWLYDMEGEVPSELYSLPLGKAVVAREGQDVTIAASSYTVRLALEAAALLEMEGLYAEVIDLRTIKPLDEKLLLESVGRTGRLVVVDGGWRTCGVAAEVAALAAEKAFEKLKSPLRRITLPDMPAPASAALEKKYYPDEIDIAETVKEVALANQTRSSLLKDGAAS